jgi:hypothetical protein
LLKSVGICAQASEVVAVRRRRRRYLRMWGVFTAEDADGWVLLVYVRLALE